MGAVGTQIVLDRLLVTDVDIEPIEDTDRRMIQHWDRDTTLDEVLK